MDEHGIIEQMERTIEEMEQARVLTQDAMRLQAAGTVAEICYQAVDAAATARQEPGIDPLQCEHVMQLALDHFEHILETIKDTAQEGGQDAKDTLSDRSCGFVPSDRNE